MIATGSLNAILQTNTQIELLLSIPQCQAMPSIESAVTNDDEWANEKDKEMKYDHDAIANALWHDSSLGKGGSHDHLMFYLKASGNK